MGLWRSKRPPRDTFPFKPDMQDMQERTRAPAPAWGEHPNNLVYTHAIPFNMGAAAFAYSLHGLPAYAPAPGFNNQYQLRTLQPPVDLYPTQKLLHAGLGQSSNMQQPAPAAERLYTVSQLDALIQASKGSGTTYFGG